MLVPSHGCLECELWQGEEEDTHSGYHIVFCTDAKTRCTEGLEDGCADVVPKG